MVIRHYGKVQRNKNPLPIRSLDGVSNCDHGLHSTKQPELQIVEVVIQLHALVAGARGIIRTQGGDHITFTK